MQPQSICTKKGVVSSPEGPLVVSLFLPKGRSGVDFAVRMGRVHVVIPSHQEGIRRESENARSQLPAVQPGQCWQLGAKTTHPARSCRADVLGSVLLKILDRHLVSSPGVNRTSKSRSSEGTAAPVRNHTRP